MVTVVIKRQPGHRLIHPFLCYDTPLYEYHKQIFSPLFLHMTNPLRSVSWQLLSTANHSCCHQDFLFKPMLKVFFCKRTQVGSETVCHVMMKGASISIQPDTQLSLSHTHTPHNTKSTHNSLSHTHTPHNTKSTHNVTPNHTHAYTTQKCEGKCQS